MTARIAICIDDFGMATAVNDAVLGLIENGRASATSCMVGAPAWTQGAPRLRALAEAGRVDAGLHIDLTEHPFDAGARRPIAGWMRSTFMRRVNRARVQAEVRAQLGLFEAAMGRAPAHVDGHQHVHQLPVVREVILEELHHRYAPGDRPWLRSTVGARRGRHKGRIIEAMGARTFAHAATRAGFKHNRSLLGVYDFEGGAERYRALLQGWLAQAHDADLLMIHVATALVPGDKIAQARVAEWQVFSQDDFDSLLRAHGVSVARMSSILA